jgi:hypothetical protein
VDEDPRRTVAELAKGMEAAGALIESLEEEAANLRHDLGRATATLRTAQVEVASSAGMLEVGDGPEPERRESWTPCGPRTPTSRCGTPTNSFG